MTVTASDAPRLSAWRSYLADLWRRREFAQYLAAANLRARNANTVLGLAWWVLNPLMLSLVYFLVFGILFGQVDATPRYLPHLLSGMFVFNFTVLSMTGGANSILGNMSLLANIRFPRLILPISALIESTIGFLASLVVFYALAIPVDGIWPSLRLLVLPAVLVLHVLFNLGLAAITARLVIPFRDINNLIPHFTRLWLYLSPIIWPLSFVTERAPWVTDWLPLNPMVPLTGLYRWVLMGSDLAPGTLEAGLAWSLGMFLLGIVAFVRYEGNMVRHI
ncbi:MAG: ABC transporter permease [Acidimicrobiia bacterium]|nr:ABC transporter permease [Acidimicrobiia bacterium]